MKYKKYTYQIKSIKDFKILKDYNNDFSKIALSLKTLDIVFVSLIRHIKCKSDPFIG